MNKYISFFLTLVVALSFAKLVFADCYCACMNGINQPFCSSSIDIAPICSPRVCPIESPSIKPLPSLNFPPLGTTSCEQEQVYDDYEGRYVWREVCY
jgi:hypothetical protein